MDIYVYLRVLVRARSHGKSPRGLGSVVVTIPWALLGAFPWALLGPILWPLVRSLLWALVGPLEGPILGPHNLRAHTPEVL